MHALQPSTLGDLYIHSYALDLRQSDPSYPLHIIARKIQYNTATEESHAGKTAVSLLLAPSLGLTTEHYEPFFKRLFKVCNEDPGCPVYIRSLWIVESPNHGDGAVLNDDIIKASEFATKFPCHTHSEAIWHVVQMCLSEEERSELVGLGHSAGCGIILGAAVLGISFKAHVFIESGFWTADANPIWERIVALAEKAEKRSDKESRWASVEEAMEYLKRQRPYNLFDAEVHAAMAEASFIDVPGGGVTMKTSTAHEMASMRAWDEGVLLSEVCIQLAPTIPTHMIQGQRRDFWPKHLNAVIEATMNANAFLMASLQHIPDVSHYPPQQNAEETAKAVVHALKSTVPPRTSPCL